MELVTLGKIIDSFGLDGSLKVVSSTQFGAARYKKGNKVYLYNESTNESIVCTVSSYRNSGNLDFVKVEEISTKEDALEKRGWFIQANKDQKLLSKDSYYFGDLLNCEVVDEKGNVLGKVIKVEEFPAQITLRVLKNNQQTFFVPFVKDFIRDVDIQNNTIRIHLIEGML